MDNTAVRSVIMVPAAILFSGLIIAIGVYIVRTAHRPIARIGAPTAVRAVTDADHIIGNPSAPVVIVEYSDIDCQFCKQFQQTLEQLSTDYASTGKIAWVYRQFPVAESNSFAVKNATASECAAKLGGVSTFWRFIDAMHAIAPDTVAFNPSRYPSLLKDFGIDANAFNQCMTSDAVAKKVQDDYDNALASGAGGAPYTVILVKGNKPIPISGSIPYNVLKKIVDDAISKATP